MDAKRKGHGDRSKRQRKEKDLVRTEFGCWCSKDLKVGSRFQCSLNASVIFKQMEGRTQGLPKPSHTKLIFTRRDLGTLGDLPGKETYVNMLHNARVMREGSWTAPYCARLEQMYMVPCRPCIGRLAAAPDLKGLSMMLFHMLSSWTSVCSVWLPNSSLARSNGNDALDGIS